MTDFPSNNSSPPPEVLADMQPQFRRLDDSKGTPITNKTTRDRQIRVTGYNVIAGSTVTIMNGNEVLGTAQSDDNGEFTTELLPLTKYDCHQVRMVDEKIPPISSVPRRFTAAREKPAITLVSSNGDPVSPGETIPGPDVTVACDSSPGGDSRLFNGETLLKTELVNGCGKVIFELTALAPGDYIIKVKDQSNNESETFKFTLGEEVVTPVTLDKVTTAAGDEVRDGDTTPETSLFVEGEGEPGEMVGVFKNGDPLGEATVDPVTGRYKHPTGPLTDNTYAFTTEGKYPGGGEAGPHTVTVEAIKKPVTLDKVTTAAGDEVRDGDTTPETSLFVEGEGEPGEMVGVFKNDDPLGEATVDPVTGRYKHPTGPLTDNTYAFTTEGKYPGGGEAGPHTVTVEAIKKPVTLDKVTTAAGDEVRDGDTTPETSLFVEGEGEPGEKVGVFKNGDPLGEATVDPVTGRYKHPTGPLTDNTYAFTTEGKYPGGGEAGPHTVTVEAIKKPVTLDKVTTAAGDEVRDGDTTPETSLFVEGEGEPGEKVGVFKNGDPLGEATVDPVTGRYKHPTGPLTDNTYAFTTEGKYPGGGEAGPHTVTVEAIKKPVTLDKVTTAAGVEVPDGETTHETSLFVEGEGEPGEKVEVSIDGGTPSEASVDVTTRRYRYPTGVLAEGRRVFTVKAKYPGGGDAGPRTVIVEAAATAPTLTRIYDADGNVIPDGGDLRANWFVARGLHTPDSAVKIRFDGVIQQKLEPTNAEGKWAFLQSNLTVGSTHEVSALREDEKAESNAWKVHVAGTSKS
ncbi:hypothetical protein J2Y86_005055 [Pseudomonas migulae]|uniref:hypothetical protein n=1 Tax=Pseudomonas migulae TaxID=78543 RepID=UPI0020A0C47E|nr:hypothetical protein [Pseudomonas migulae]MCP1500348.1 hypothetical protein [Pseudomonas migulae]